MAHMQSVVPIGNGNPLRIDRDTKNMYANLRWKGDVDLDVVSCLYCCKGDLPDCVWHRNPESRCKSVTHSGDKRSGEGNGENIVVNIPAIPNEVHYILFVVSIHSLSKTFKDVNIACVTLTKEKGVEERELLNLQLEETSATSIAIGVMVRRGASWDFVTLGVSCNGRNIYEIVKENGDLLTKYNIQSTMPPCRKITLTVTHGEGLALIKNTFGLNCTQPYVKIKYKKEYWASDYRKKQINPNWTEKVFELGLVSEDDENDVIIEVFSYRSRRNDQFMGMVRVPSSILYRDGEGEHEHAYDLGPSKDFSSTNVGGKIHFKAKVLDYNPISI